MLFAGLMRFEHDAEAFFHEHDQFQGCDRIEDPALDQRQGIGQIGRILAWHEFVQDEIFYCAFDVVHVPSSVGVIRSLVCTALVKMASCRARNSV